MGIHASAQAELSTAFQAVFGRPPTKNERLFAGAIAFGESGYARARFTNKLTGESKVLNNWGAIQCPSATRPCPPGSFEVSDFEVKEDGSHVPFNQCYCDDATRELAAERFIRTLYQKRPQLLQAAEAFPIDARTQLLALGGVNKLADPAPLYDGKGGTAPLSDPYYQHLAWFSHVMRDSKYFGLELAKHVGAQIRYHNAIAADTGERVDGGPANMPSPKVPAPDGSLADFFSALLDSLSEDAEQERFPHFGIATHTFIRLWQKSHGLNPDGLIGLKETIPALRKLK